MRRLHTYQHTPYGDRFRCRARDQLVPATREEQVRQDAIRTLIEVYGYPKASIGAEEPVARGTSNRGRADVIVRLRA